MNKKTITSDQMNSGQLGNKTDSNLSMYNSNNCQLPMQNPDKSAALPAHTECWNDLRDEVN